MKRSWMRCELLERSQAEIYLAADHETGNLFVVKTCLCKDKHTTREILNEITMFLVLESPQIVRYFGSSFSREGGKSLLNLFIEYMPGGSLRQHIARLGGQLKDQLIKTYTRSIVEALYHLHSKGIVHCDVKADNILVGTNGIKLSDFGGSKFEVSDVRKTVRGTPAWMAPEVLTRVEQGFPSDIWSLGCTMIEMATGQDPWGNISSLEDVQISYKIPDVSALSLEGQRFAKKCLVMNPKDRWTASELLQDDYIVHETINLNYKGISALQRIRATFPDPTQTYKSLDKQKSNQNKVSQKTIGSSELQNAWSSCRQLVTTSHPYKRSSRLKKQKVQIPSTKYYCENYKSRQKNASFLDPLDKGLNVPNKKNHHELKIKKSEEPSFELKKLLNDNKEYQFPIWKSKQTREHFKNIAFKSDQYYYLQTPLDNIKKLSLTSTINEKNFHTMNENKIKPLRRQDDLEPLKNVKLVLDNPSQRQIMSHEIDLCPIHKQNHDFHKYAPLKKTTKTNREVSNILLELEPNILRNEHSSETLKESLELSNLTWKDKSPTMHEKVKSSNRLNKNSKKLTSLPIPSHSQYQNRHIRFENFKSMDQSEHENNSIEDIDNNSNYSSYEEDSERSLICPTPQSLPCVKFSKINNDDSIKLKPEPMGFIMNWNYGEQPWADFEVKCTLQAPSPTLEDEESFFDSEVQNNDTFEMREDTDYEDLYSTDSYQEDY